jgi:hypothetical protein
LSSLLFISNVALPSIQSLQLRLQPQLQLRLCLLWMWT